MSFPREYRTNGRERRCEISKSRESFTSRFRALLDNHLRWASTMLPVRWSKRYTAKITKIKTHRIRRYLWMEKLPELDPEEDLESADFIPHI